MALAFSEGKRCSVCLALATEAGALEALEKELRRLEWPERGLTWHQALASSGASAASFDHADMYTEFSDSAQDLPPWRMLSAKPPEAGTRRLHMTCSLVGANDDDRFAFSEQLLAWLLDASCAGSTLVGARVLAVSWVKRLPLAELPEGLGSLLVRPGELSSTSRAKELLKDLGVLLMPEALAPEQLQALRQLAAVRVRSAEEELGKLGLDIGSGEISFSEIGSRGVQRWDLLVHLAGESVGAEGICDDAVLVQVASQGPWLEVVRSTLGAFTWQASIICSRAGAPAGRWHADGPHSRFVFEGESGDAYALCIFVPLVPLESSTESTSGAVKHGRGCTYFWPGSHRYRECAHLGSAAAERMHAVVPGAPLGAGSALMYDYRTVHCAGPNDAFELPDSDRPLLQITYCRAGAERLISDNYGYEQLFCD